MPIQEMLGCVSKIKGYYGLPNHYSKPVYTSDLSKKEKVSSQNVHTKPWENKYTKISTTPYLNPYAYAYPNTDNLEM